MAERKLRGVSEKDHARQVHRYTINFTKDFFDDLRSYADDRGITITELIRQALTYERFLYDHRDWEFVMAQETSEGRRERELVLPLMNRPATASVDRTREST